MAAAREKLALLEDEKRSLQVAIDGSLNETARLTRRLTESENTLTATRAQLGKVEASFAEAYAERGRLAAALDEAKEQHQAERNSLNMRLDALQSRAATAERLLSEARQNLIARTEEVRAFDRKSVEATIGRNNSEKRLAQIEASHDARERQIKDLDRRARRPDRAQQRHDQDAEDARNRARPRRGKDRRAHRAQRASGSRRAGVAAPTSKSASRNSMRLCNASAWNARWWKARWKPRARTIRACKAKSARCARRCGAARRWSNEAPVAPRRARERGDRQEPKGKDAEAAGKA